MVVYSRYELGHSWSVMMENCLEDPVNLKESASNEIRNIVQHQEDRWRIISTGENLPLERTVKAITSML